MTMPSDVITENTMQPSLLAAAALALFTGIAHSLLGEILIFRHLRQGTIVPGLAAPPLRVAHVRILWATWHLATVFGWALAGIVLLVARSSSLGMTATLLLYLVIAAYAVAALLVLVARRGRHPGWIALLVVAVLVWASFDQV